MWGKGWFLGTKCSPPPVTVASAAEKPLVVTVESIAGDVVSVVVTAKSQSTKILQSWL